MISKKRFIVGDPLCYLLNNRYNDEGSQTPGKFFFYNPKTKNYIFQGRSGMGYFAHECREVVASWWDAKHVYPTRQLKHLGFRGVKSIELLDKFFNEIETGLKLKRKTVFCPVNDGKNTVLIFPSNFWLKNLFRYNFLTLFIRCGSVFYSGNFGEALNTYSLTNKISSATWLFLNGKTNFIGEFCEDKGVVYSLQGFSTDYLIQNMLSDKELNELTIIM